MSPALIHTHEQISQRLRRVGSCGSAKSIHLASLKPKSNPRGLLLLHSDYNIALLTAAATHGLQQQPPTLCTHQADWSQGDCAAEARLHRASTRARAQLRFDKSGVGLVIPVVLNKRVCHVSEVDHVQQRALCARYMFRGALLSLLVPHVR